MRILITNDDGIDSDGIKSLKKIALEISSQRLSHSNKNTSLEIHEELTNIKKRLEHLEKNKIHALSLKLSS